MGDGAVTSIRDHLGRFMRLAHDQHYPWVLVDFDVQPPEPVLKCATRQQCREHQRHAGGRIVRTFAGRRKAA